MSTIVDGVRLYNHHSTTLTNDSTHTVYPSLIGSGCRVPSFGKGTTIAVRNAIKYYNRCLLCPLCALYKIFQPTLILCCVGTYPIIPASTGGPIYLIIKFFKIRIGFVLYHTEARRLQVEIPVISARLLSRSRGSNYRRSGGTTGGVGVCVVEPLLSPDFSQATTSPRKATKNTDLYIYLGFSCFFIFLS